MISLALLLGWACRPNTYFNHERDHPLSPKKQFLARIRGAQLLQSGDEPISIPTGGIRSRVERGEQRPESGRIHDSTLLAQSWKEVCETDPSRHSLPILRCTCGRYIQNAVELPFPRPRGPAFPFESDFLIQENSQVFDSGA
jgi:hypothetical protein